jgi:hypothetical protein
LQERLAIVSDDADQFNVLRHGLCWIHALNDRIAQADRIPLLPDIIQSRAVLA